MYKKGETLIMFVWLIKITFEKKNYITWAFKLLIKIVLLK